MALNQLGLGFTFSAKDLASAVVQRVTTGLEQLTKGADSTADKIRSMATTLQGQFQKFKAVGDDGIAFFMSAADHAGDFGKVLGQVAARANAATFPMAKVEDLAFRLSRQFGTMPADQADAIFQAIGQGATSAATAEQLLAAANALAKSGVADLGSSISAVSELLKSYGLGFEHASEASDALYIASKRSGVGVADLAGELHKVAPQAARAGLSMQDLLGTIAGMSAAGLEGRQALNALRGMLDSITAPSAQTAAAASALGINLSAATLKAKGLPAVLQEIMEKTHGDSAALAKLFGNTELAGAAMALMRNNGAALNDALAEMKNSTGAAAAQADKMVGAGARFAALKEQALILIGQAIKPLLNSIKMIGVYVLTAFTMIPKPIIQFGAVLGVALSAIVSLAGGVGAMVAGLIAAKVVLAPVLLGLAAMIGMVVSLTAVLVPLVGGLALIGYGLKVAFDKNLGGFRDAVLGFVEKIKLAYEGLRQLFADGALSGAVMTELGKAENSGIKRFVVAVFMWGERIKAFFTSIGTGFSSALEKAGPVFERLGLAFRQLGAALGLMTGPNDPKQAAHSFDAFAAAGAKVGEVLSRVVTFATRVISTVVELSTAFVGVLSRSGAWDKLGESITAIVAAFGSLGDAFSSGGTKAGETSNVLLTLAKVLAVEIAGAARVAAFVISAIAAHVHVAAAGIHGLSNGFAVFKQTAMASSAAVFDVLMKLLLPIAKIVDAFAKLRGQQGGAVAALQGLSDTLHKGGEGPAGKGAAGREVVTVPTVATVPQVTPAPPGTNVAAAAAGAGAGGVAGAGQGGPSKGEVTAAIQAGMAAAKPADVNLGGIELIVDGERLADAVSAKTKGNGARGFAPAPPPK